MVIISDTIQFYFKTKIVKSKEMDFSAAQYFDEEDRLKEMAPQEQEQGGKTGKEAWIKRIRYMIFGLRISWPRIPGKLLDPTPIRLLPSLH